MRHFFAQIFVTSLFFALPGLSTTINQKSDLHGYYEIRGFEGRPYSVEIKPDGIITLAAYPSYTEREGTWDFADAKLTVRYSVRHEQNGPSLPFELTISLNAITMEQLWAGVEVESVEQLSGLEPETAKLTIQKLGCPMIRLLDPRDFIQFLDDSNTDSVEEI